MGTADLLVFAWNRKPGLMASCRIWLERVGGSYPYRIRWRGGEWNDRDGQATVRSLGDAATVMRYLIDTSTVPLAGWQVSRQD